MYIIGLDFSINYASFCVSKNFQEFTFGTIINDKSLSLKRKSELISISEYIDSFNVIFTSRTEGSKKESESDYIKNERLKLLNHIEISSKLINEINKITNYSKDVIVGIEGMSYGSQGSAAFDIPHATGILKRDILFDLIGTDINKLFIFAPGELKNSIGAKGNAGKDVIYDAFMENPIIETLKDNDFYNYLQRHKDENYIRHVCKNGIKIESPFSDMIDSYLSVVKIYNILR